MTYDLRIVYGYEWFYYMSCRWCCGCRLSSLFFFLPLPFLTFLLLTVDFCFLPCLIQLPRLILIPMFNDIHSVQDIRQLLLLPIENRVRYGWFGHSSFSSPFFPLPSSLFYLCFLFFTVHYLGS